MIPSPYNFVPLSKKVFFPPWADLVSMDVPFSDGISGIINIKVKARTPIYIRNTQNQAHDNRIIDGEAHNDFFRVTKGGKYAIPGTSFKGMLRNVIEIITFSKIAGSRDKSSRVSEHRYAVRDLHNSEVYTSKMSERNSKGAYKPKACAGWLAEDEEGNWTVTPCDFARVEQEELEKFFRIGNNGIGEKMSAVKKYGKIKPYTKIRFSCEAEDNHPHSCGNLLYKKVTKLSGGDKEGVVVLTGQPSDRGKVTHAKHMEFIFFDESKEAMPISNNLKEDFIFVHSELGENRKQNEEWGFWNKKLREGLRVPVFFLWQEIDKSIKSMGLALMFRLPYDFTVLDAVEHTSPDHLDSSRLDMAETMFGRAEDQSALKGRINAETLIVEGEPLIMAPVKTVLGMPRPTYYPNYIKQAVNPNDPTTTGRYNTFMDSNCEIRGWKRYLARKNPLTGEEIPSAPNSKVETVFRLLPAGTVFSGKIRLHNVRPEELGALIWALTWGGDAKMSHSHSIGMGKPYGFGSISVSITSCELSQCNLLSAEAVDVEACKERFLQLMSKELGRSLVETEEVKALMAMANPDIEWDQLQNPVYPTLRGDLSFVSYKKSKKILAFLPKQPERKKPPKPIQAVAPKIKLEGVDRLVDELSKAKTLNFKDVSNLIKSCGVMLDTVTAEDKKRVYEQLKKQAKNADSRLRGLIDDWSGE